MIYVKAQKEAKIDGGEQTGNAFQARLVELLEGSDKSLREIAREMDYKHANILSMFKAGVTRVPLDKVPELAAALEQDEGELVRLWIDSYSPEIRPILERAFGAPVTEYELAWLKSLRQMLGGPVPPFDDDAIDALAGYTVRRRLQRG